MTSMRMTTSQVMGAVLITTAVVLFSLMTLINNSENFLWEHSDNSEPISFVERLRKRTLKREELRSQESPMVEDCKKNHVLPSGGYCLQENSVFDGRNEVWDVSMCLGLEKLFGNSSVGDFGAGLGHYGRCFLRVYRNVIMTKHKAEANFMMIDFSTQMTIGRLWGKPQVIRSWTGYDGALNIEKLSQGFVKYADLTEQQDLGIRFDWVMSLEVGEHIPSEFESKFIHNLITHACKGLVLSWSTVVGKGHFHVNPRPNEYIIHLVTQYGLIHDPVSQEFLRNYVTMQHFKPGLLVFRVPTGKCSS